MNKTIKLILVVIAFSFQQMIQAQTSAYWRLESNNEVKVEGNITALDEVYSNTVFDRYTTLSDAVWPDYTGYDSTRKTQRLGILGGEWPGEEAYVADRYVQFGIKANDDCPLNVEKISLFIGGYKTGVFQCNVLYDTDEQFSHPVMIGDFSAKGALPSNNMKDVVAETDIDLEPGESLYLRIYPWTKSAATSKSFCISDVRFDASAKSTTNINTVGQFDQTEGIYSIDGVRHNEYTKGINIVRTAGKTIKVVKH